MHIRTKSYNIQDEMMECGEEELKMKVDNFREFVILYLIGQTRVVFSLGVIL